MIACAACNHGNPDENRYCGMCGARLERRRMPDSELLPEDSEGHAPAADLPRAAWPSNGGSAGASPSSAAMTTPAPQLAQSAVAEPSSSAHGSNESYSVSGPSILGLNEPATTNPDYLLEDDQPRHSARKWFLGIMVLIGILAYGQWRANGHGSTLFAGLPAIRAPRPVLANPQPAAAPAPDQDEDAPEMAVEPEKSTPKAANDNAARPGNAGPDPGTKTKAADQPSGDWKPLLKPAQAEAGATKATTQNPNGPADSGAGTIESAATSRPAVTPTAAKSRAATGQGAHSGGSANNSASLLAQGQKYLYGQGVRKSCDQALNLIHSAAGEGNAEARSQLGGMYATGNCAPFDRVTAYRWFTLALAVSPHNPNVLHTRDMLWREMTDIERQRARAQSE